MLWSPFVGKAKTQDRMKLPISKLVELIGKKPIAPGTTHLVVETLLCDEEGEDVDVSFIICFFDLLSAFSRCPTPLFTSRYRILHVSIWKAVIERSSDPVSRAAVEFVMTKTCFKTRSSFSSDQGMTITCLPKPERSAAMDKASSSRSSAKAVV